ncbi:unnamed protein product [Symbiodinium sp. CCMP2592]|nr:unnamed protein product [Symbiodinium sp. CCMP2592]
MEDHPEPLTRHQAILRGLEALGEAHLDHPVLQRAVGSKFLPQRLRERWQALGIGNEHASNASSAEDSAETRKRLRMEAMRQRQQALMRRMQQQQSQAVAAMDEAAQGALNDETEAEDSGALWQCATCREAGTPENPLAMLAAVVPWQSKSTHRGGLPGYARFTSCRHLVHVSCGLAHAEDVRNQAGRSQFFFVNATGGEFPCPMCRSVANCLIPCVPDEEFLDSEDASWQPEVSHSASAPSRVRPPLPALQSALHECMRRASRAGAEARPEQREGQLDDSQGALSVPVLRAAAAELRAAAALFPLQLTDEGPPAPLYAALFRAAALLRSGAPTVAPKLEDSGWQSKVLAWLSQPREPWLLDLKVKATEALVVHSGVHLTVVACPASLGEDAQIVQLQGSDEHTQCNVVFYAVDSTMLELEGYTECQRFSSPPDPQLTIAAFQETCDACFAPALRCEAPQHVVELGLSATSRRFLWNSVVIVPDFLTREECHVLMDAADRAAAVGTRAGSFYAYQGNMNRFLAATWSLCHRSFLAQCFYRHAHIHSEMLMPFFAFKSACALPVKAWFPMPLSDVTRSLLQLGRGQEPCQAQFARAVLGKQKILTKPGAIARLLRELKSENRADLVLCTLSEVRKGGTPIPHHFDTAISACSLATWWQTGLSLLTSMPVEEVPVNIVSCNTGIGCADQWHLALGLFRWMGTNRITKDFITHNSCIGACARDFEWQVSVQLLQVMQLRTVSPDIISLNSCMNFPARASLWHLPGQLLRSMREARILPSVVTCSSSIGCSDGQGWLSALQLLAGMHQLGVRLNAVSINSCIACISSCSSEWQTALLVFKTATGGRVSPTGASYNTCISALQSSGNWQLALHFLHVMGTADIPAGVIAYSSCISCCEEAGRWQLALQLLHSMEAAFVKPNLISFSACISCCAKANEWQKALRLLRVMVDAGTRQDTIIYNACISACDIVGQWQIALHLLEAMTSAAVRPNLISCNSCLCSLERGFQWQQSLLLLASMLRSNIAPDVVTYNSCIGACEKCGQWEMALNLFQTMSRRRVPADVVSCNACIISLEKKEHWQLALQFFDIMSQALLRPNAVSYCEWIVSFERCHQPGLLLRMSDALLSSSINLLTRLST